MNDILTPEQYDLQTAALKVPPHSIEAEQAVLGGLMLDNNAAELCVTARLNICHSETCVWLEAQQST